MAKVATTADRLRAERTERLAMLAAETWTGRTGLTLYDRQCNEARIAVINRELARLARRRAYSREHRQVLYDLNGHHGPA